LLILCDIKSERRHFADELRKEHKVKVNFYDNINDILRENRQLHDKRLVVFDATNHNEKNTPSEDAFTFAKNHDHDHGKVKNIFIDAGMNMPVGYYANKFNYTESAVGSEYVSFTNKIMIDEICNAAKSINKELSAITSEEFDKKVKQSVEIRDRFVAGINRQDGLKKSSFERSVNFIKEHPFTFIALSVVAILAFILTLPILTK
jgi:hypothetical protein